jgi:DNA-directed RNA polymerase specialized sigma24 family protein
VQEAFVLALAKLDISRNPRAWLYQVVDHLSKNFQRKAARRARLVATFQPVRAARETEIIDEN